MLEAELIINGSSRANEAYSDQNPVFFENGSYVRVLANPPIVHWHIEWRYKLTIHNNSSYPAFNVSVNSIRYSDEMTPVFRTKVPHLFRSKVRQPDRP